jgi:hypothetical protein
MDAIRRTSPAYEQAMWHDTLPASIVVPAHFTWHVPGDLDLGGTDLTVNGTVELPPVPSPVVAASETAAGVVELATQAEVDAGTDAVRAVTPATLAAWPGGGGGGVLCNEAEFIVGDDTGYAPTSVQVNLALDGVAIAQQVAMWYFAVFSDSNDVNEDLRLNGSGFLIYPRGTVQAAHVIASDIDGTLTIMVGRSTGAAGNARLAAVLPTGEIAYSDSFRVGDVEPP